MSDASSNVSNREIREMYESLSKESLINILVDKFNKAKYSEDLKLLTNPCPDCGYPTFKKSHEDFNRCHGCCWTDK